MGKKSKKFKLQQKNTFLKRRCIHQLKKVEELVGILSFIERQMRQNCDHQLYGLSMLIRQIQAQLENRCQLLCQLLDVDAIKNNTAG